MTTWVPDLDLGAMRANLRVNGHQLYVGTDGQRLRWAGPQQAVLVVGPPRAGKTSALVIPNVLAAPGAVLTTSTKPDVLDATWASRSEQGRCWVLDPTGSVPARPGVEAVRWSPVAAAGSWEEALVTARVMTVAARPGTHGESSHWTERAEALLAPLLHAAAGAGLGMRQVVGWCLRRELDEAQEILASARADLAGDVLAGLAATDERELSGIWSTAASTLAAYRSEAALERGAPPYNLDPAALAGSGDTVYVCAPARAQALVAPIVVAFIEQVRAGAYRVAAQPDGGAPQVPLVLALDEVANIAPLPDLPAMVSEGGGQGVLTLACLQDLSQGRARWGRQADGFFSLFGTKVVLPGIGDGATLEAVSRLAGQNDVAVRSVSRVPWWAGRGGGTTTWSLRRQATLPVDAVHQLAPGTALVIAAAQPPEPIGLTPWWSYPPFCQAAGVAPPAATQPPTGSPSTAPPAPTRPPTGSPLARPPAGGMRP